MKEQLISIIIPTFNRMNTLPRAVESVLRQTYQNFELIIVDDCSSDTTKEYIDSLADERVRYHRNEKNMGAAESRNIGVSLAKGEYIAFQDSDDEWLPNKLEDVLACLDQEENQDADLIFHQMEEIDGDHSRLITNIHVTDISTELYPYMLCFPVVGPPASLIKRQTFLELGGFCAQCKSFEDYELSLRFAKNKKVVYLPKALTRVYDSPDSVNKNFEAKIDTEAYIIKKLFSDYQRYDLLQRKIELVRMQAVNYDCEAYFYEKIMDVYEELTDKNAEELLYKLLLVSISQRGSASDKSEHFREAAGTLSHISDSLKRLKGNIKKSPQILMQNISSIKQALEDVVRDMLFYCNLTDHPPVQKNKMNMIAQELGKSGKNTAMVKAVLDDLIMETESIIGQINQTKYVCGKCGQEVKMLPMSPYHNVLRKRLGFADDTITFLFENENADICPACGGSTEERFLLTFLDDIQPEGDEILSIALVDGADNESGTGNMPALANYQRMKTAIKEHTRSRNQVKYIDHISEAQVDILICCDLLNNPMNPEIRLSKMENMIKKTGAVLVMIPAVRIDIETYTLQMSDTSDVACQMNPEESIRLFGMENVCRIYSERELTKLFSDSGFQCTVIDKEWFGNECYEQMAFPNEARLFMLEKMM